MKVGRASERKRGNNEGDDDNLTVRQRYGSQPIQEVGQIRQLGPIRCTSSRRDSRHVGLDGEVANGNRMSSQLLRSAYLTEYDELTMHVGHVFHWFVDATGLIPVMLKVIWHRAPTG